MDVLQAYVRDAVPPLSRRERRHLFVEVLLYRHCQFFVGGRQFLCLRVVHLPPQILRHSPVLIRRQKQHPIQARGLGLGFLSLRWHPPSSSSSSSFGFRGGIELRMLKWTKAVETLSKVRAVM
jgi:hypothetical protein